MNNFTLLNTFKNRRFSFTNYLQALLVILLVGLSQLGFGQAFNATYALTANGNSVVSGNVTSANLVGGSNIGAITYGASNGLSANGFGSAAQNINDYYEYSITPVTGNNLAINSTSFYYSVSGGSMNLVVFYSKDNFATSGTQLGSIVNFSNTSSTVQFTNSTSITVNSGETLKVRVYGYGASADTRTFRNKTFVISGTSSPNGCTAPSTLASNYSFSNVGQTQMDVAFTVGSGAGRVVKMNTSNSFTAPTAGSNPSASTTYSGSGEQVVYNGTGSSFTVTGLNPSTPYYFSIYEYCSPDRTYGSGFAGNQTTAASSNPVLGISGTTAHGSVCTNVAATSQTYTITNSGLAQADGISVVSSDSQFVVSGLSSTSISASGGTASYVVTFTPSSSGAKSATITVSSTTSGSNAPTSPLTGTGTATVSQTVTSSAATSVLNTSATLNGNVTALGICPATTEKGFVYSLTATNADPLVAGTGVTKTVVSSLVTGAYTLPLTSLTQGTGYSFKAYVFDGTTYVYGTVQNFTTTAPPANDLCSNAIDIQQDGVSLNGTQVASTTSFTTSATGDVWYKFVANCTGTYTISSVNNGMDLDLYITASACPAVNTDYFASGNTSSSTTSESFTASLTSGTLYYVRVANFSVTQNTFTIKVTPPTPVTGVIVTNAVSALSGVSATLNGSVTTLGVCPTTSEKGFVYSLTATNNDPTNGGTGVTTTPVSGLATGAYTFGLTSLTTLTGYSYKAYIKDELGNYTYGALQSFTTISNEPTTQPTVLTRLAVSTTSMTIGWTAATSSPDGYIVMRRQNTAYPTTAIPVDGTTYTLGQTLGNGTVEYVGSSLSAAMSGLTAGLPYSYYVFSYNGSGTSINYLQTSPLQGFTYTLAAEPAVHSNSFTLNSVTSSTATLGFQSPTTIGATRYLIIRKVGSVAPTTMPTDGALFGADSGDAVFVTNTPTTTTVSFLDSGLTAGTTYTYLLIPFNRVSNDVSCNYNINPTIPSLTITTPNSNSDVVAVASSEAISISSLINDGAPLTSSTGKEVWKFTIRDGAVATDTDGLPTKVSGFTIAKAAASGLSDFSGAIKTAAIFDSGNNFVATASSITATSIVFSGLNLVIPNNSSETYSLRLSLKEIITGNANIDGKDFVFSLSNANITALTDGTSSRFSSFAAAVSTDTKNLVDVTAVALVFSVQPQALTNVNAAMNTMTVTALDVYNNVDADFVDAVTISSTGTVSGTLTVNAVAGVASFAGLTHTASGTGLKFTATNGTLTIDSSLFDILGSPVATAATLITPNSFNANWNADLGATSGYALEVSTSSTFTSDGVATLNESFESAVFPTSYPTSVTDYAIPGSGTWTLFQTLATTAAGNFSQGAAGMQMKASVSAYFTSPSFNKIASLTFKMKGTSSAGNNIKVYKVVSGVDTEIGSFAITSSFVQQSITVNDLNDNVKIKFLNTGSNAAYIDEVVINYTTIVPSFVAGYNPLLVSGQATTTAAVTGLTPVTTYYYRVRAINGATQSANSNVITVTTIQASCTWNGTSWTNTVGPDSSIEAIIAGVYDTTANGEFTAKKVTVNSGSLTVKSGTTITIQNELINNLAATAVVVENNANLIQVNNVANTGNITVKRNSSSIKRLDYTLWSSPVANQNLLSFSPLTSVTPTSRFYTYNTATNQFNTVAASSTSFGMAAGYLIRVANNHTTWASTWSGSFVGVPNNGNQTFTMTNNGAGQQFNLVGNPYPSPLSMTQFVADNASNITGTLYFWRETNGVTTNNPYSTWVGGVFTSNGQAQVSDPNGIIRTGQGFMVEASGAATSLGFNNGQRVADTANQFFKSSSSVAKNQSTERHTVWLNATSATGEFSQMAVSYSANGTQGIDAFDGKDINNGTLALSTVMNSTNYVVQSRALPFQSTDVVPLNFKATNAGQYTLTLDHVEGLFSSGNQDVFIKDNLDGTYHDLNEGSYDFTTNAGTFANRFELVYQATLTNNQNLFSAENVVVFKQQNDVVVNTGTKLMSNVKVYDVRGRLLVEKSKINTSEVKLTIDSTNEVLLIKITSVDGVVVTKKIIN